MAYFEKLNYTLSNEDTRVEHELLPENAKSVLAIAGSGARVLPLIARNPAALEVIDLADAQLYLCELRLAAARQLEYDEFLFFLGYRGGLFEGNPKGDDRYKLFQKLNLSGPCREFWIAHSNQWRPHGFIFLGKWEDHFQKLGKIFRKGFRINFMPIFEAQSLEEQLDLYKKHWKPLIFRNFLRIAASEYVFNKFLYKGHFAGGSDRSTEKRPPWQFLDEEFKRLFTTTLVRKNYFLQVLFLGRIRFEEGLPLEAHPSVIAAIKKSSTEVTYTRTDLLDHLPKKPYDFISLSDTISYLPKPEAEAILSKFHPEMRPGSRVVIRSFLRAPTIDCPAPWISEEERNTHAFEIDGTAVYRFHIYRKG